MDKQKPSEQKEVIHINTAIALATITTILPLFGILVIPNTWWGILIKIILAIIILAVLKNYFFHPMWEKASGFGAGIILNMIWFTSFWFLSSHWISYIFVVLFLVSLGTMKYVLKKYYNDAR